MRKRHALLSLALAAALALLALVAPSPAQAAEPSFWSDDGVRAEAYASKDDATQTITISTPAELGLLAHEVNEGNTYAGWTVRLDADIDLFGHVWDPIGQAGDEFGQQLRGFAGAFDGQGHTISNMTITADKSGLGDASEHRYGLFGVLRGDAVSVRNLTIADSAIDFDGSTMQGRMAGMLAGSAYSTTIENVTIRNCSIDAHVISGKDSLFLGGVAGSMYALNFESASVSHVLVLDVSISGSNPTLDPEWGNVGGIVGFQNNHADVKISDCVVLRMDYSGLQQEALRGGLSGQSQFRTVYEACFYDGDDPLFYDIFSNPLDHTQSSCSRVNDDLSLETPLVVGGEQRDTLLDALNARRVEQGLDPYTCADLGIEHAWVVIGTPTADTHSLECSACGASTTEPHSGGTATCAAQAACAACGTPYGDLNPASHAGLEHVRAVAATPQAPGTREHWRCTGCGALFLDAQGTQPTDAASLAVAYVPPASGGETTGGGQAEGERPAGGASPDDLLPATGDSPAPVALVALVGGLLALSGAAVRRRRG